MPGPCDEVLAQVGDDGVGAHHLRAEDVAEDTVIIVEVDGQQLSLWRGAERKRGEFEVMNEAKRTEKRREKKAGLASTKRDDISAQGQASIGRGGLPAGSWREVLAYKPGTSEAPQH
ncbi:hypothetical protein EYF80_015344 [Liparis tanakae]|uniref:Uncharacterized protein n=1 Tax=Liparis tanakae TaxID=230148 RepID=A0A4Z2IAF5_9TELE|nr:hypothetical protein EYF80_015344 [Liparis tanakae]